jgi:hypothetical protein
MRVSQERQLTLGNPTQDVVTFMGRDDAEPRKMVLRLQLSDVVTPPDFVSAPPPTVVTVTVTEITDGVPFSHEYTLGYGAPQTFRYLCAGIAVVATLTGSASPPGASATVSATLSDAEVATGADAFSVQACTPVVDAKGGQLYIGQGTVMMVQALLTLVPAANVTPVFPMLFDATEPPVNGDAPIVFGVLGALVNVGQGTGLGDELAPGVVSVAEGLYVALSTTADTFTDAGAGYALRADGKVGV